MAVIQKTARAVFPLPVCFPCYTAELSLKRKQLYTLFKNGLWCVSAAVAPVLQRMLKAISCMCAKQFPVSQPVIEMLKLNTY